MSLVGYSPWGRKESDTTFKDYITMLLEDSSSTGKESPCNAGDPGSVPGGRKICWRRDRLPTPVFLGFACGSTGKESACSAGDLGSVSALGRYSGEGKGYPLQYSGLENSIDRIVHGVAKSRT